MASALIIITGLALIIIIKSVLPSHAHYHILFAPPEAILKNLKAFIAFSFTYSFNSGVALFVSFLVLLAATAYGLAKYPKRVTGILVVSCVASLAVTILSNWVYINQSGSRYFSLPVTLFLIGSSIVLPKLNLTLRLLSLFAAAIVGINSFSQINPNIRLETTRPTRAEIQQIANEAGDYNAFGDYWCVYLYAAFKPGIKVSPDNF